MPPNPYTTKEETYILNWMHDSNQDETYLAMSQTQLSEALAKHLQLFKISPPGVTRSSGAIRRKLAALVKEYPDFVIPGMSICMYFCLPYYITNVNIIRG